MPGGAGCLGKSLTGCGKAGSEYKGPVSPDLAKLGGSVRPNPADPFDHPRSATARVLLGLVVGSLGVVLLSAPPSLAAGRQIPSFQEISLSPDSGPAGSTVNISGSGFSANYGASFLWDGSAIGSSSTDSKGNLEATFKVPPDAAEGPHTLQVCVDCDSLFETATAVFTVTAKPTSTPAPPGGCIGITGAPCTATPTRTVLGPSPTATPFPLVPIGPLPEQVLPQVIPVQGELRPPPLIRDAILTLSADAQGLPTAVPGADIRVCGVEVTQGIQSYPSSGASDEIPLVGFKRTVVRVYLSGNGQSWSNVTGQLRIGDVDAGAPFRAGDHIHLPSNARGVITVPPDCSSRTQLDQGLYFILGMEDVLPGGRTLEINVDSSRSGRRESDYVNNTFTRTATFGPGYHLTMYGVNYSNCDASGRTTLAAPPFSDFEAHRQYIEGVLPVSYYLILPVPGNPTRCENNTDGEAYVRGTHWGAELANGICGSSGCGAAVMQPEGAGYYGWCCDASFFPTFSLRFQNLRSDAGPTIAQEHAHWYIGSWHTFDADSPYPRADGSLGSQTGLRIIGPFFAAPTNLRTYPGTTTRDIMSYGPPAIWISPYTYCRLLEMITRNTLTCPASIQRAADPVRDGAGLAALVARPLLVDEVAALSGSRQEALPFATISGVVFQDGRAEIFPVTVEGSDQNPSQVSPGDDFTIRLEDSTGGSLAEYPFGIGPWNVHPDEATLASFGLVVPFPEAASRIVLAGPQGELAERTVSANAPTVVLVDPPIGSELAGQQTVTWKASDADGEDLQFAVEYSLDEASTWSTLNSGLTGASAIVDFDAVPGSPALLLRIVANDGVHSAVDVSDGSYVVAPKPPIVELQAPADGSVFYQAEPVAAAANAFDWEDGATVDPTAFHWSSDRDGDLGSGLWTVFSNLSPGEHLLTVSVTDSSGAAASDSVHITVRSESWVSESAAPQAAEGSTPAGTETSGSIAPVILAALGVGLLLVSGILALVYLGRRSRRGS
jgi:hypothetical protein